MVQRFHRDWNYWDNFVSMLTGSALGLGFLFYGLSVDQLIQKAIGAVGGGGFGGAAIYYSKRVRDREFYISCIEETDRQIFIESCNQTLEEFISPPPPEPPPEPPINAPALPVAGVEVESPEQMWKRCECPKDDPKLRQLWDYLSAHAPAVLMLLERQVLLVFGEQGSGKTTFIAFLILLRHLFLDHELIVCDPHAHQNRDKWLGGACQVHGDRYNYDAISLQIDDYFERLKAEHVGKPITSVWDEFTNYDERLPDGDKGFVKSAMSDARKADEYPVLVGHADTNGALGGSKGTSKMRDRGLTKILLLGEPDARGKVRPQMRGTIVGLFKDDEGNPLKTPFELYEWMNPGYLLSIFPHLKAPSEMRKRIENNLAKLPEPEPGSFEPEPPREPSQKQPEPPLNLSFSAEPTANPIPENWEYFNPIDFGTSSSTSLVRAVIVACIRSGWSQNRTIESVFGIKRGGSESYAIARDIYQSIKDIVEE